ncbi:hypothetical protein BN59_00639 [Legionella massiliensis]|uniref:Uncharacterized protein n=1 Tax=Legionella massiliensis TaxID=1034943 RepID=A0A078KPN9_9GAMM|nr:hypothetical protein [Legionella massiliensis]CDZ76370.1 hypothetical protein BN59_00639 [Legionella massiliensis]CEE12108.1 hypothetical protein BN1094_00639 [Legionella massiliensis]
MKPIEEQVISNLKKSDTLDNETKGVLLQLINDEPLGTSSAEFRNHPALRNHFDEKSSDELDYFMLWLRIEEYISNKNDIATTQERLSSIEEALKKCMEQVTPQAKARGTSMLPVAIANSQFMRRLYTLSDESLINMFLKYLPTPRANVFKGQDLPKKIFKREQDSTKAIVNLLERNQNDLPYVEGEIVKVQRRIRDGIRKEHNLQRLPHRYRYLWQNPDQPMTSEDGEKFAKTILLDANKPYQPKCEEKLAKRIMEAAKRVELFSTVTHLTAASALESIFNDGLYGRRNMLELYMSFRPASLFPSDIEDGDANVVCLGANAIDPQAKQGIQLQFDIKMVTANNPCVFYKQRDLGFDPEKIRNVKIGNLDLYFSHTGTYRGQPNEVSSLVLYCPSGKEIYALSNITKALLIADNTKDMHQILTLNFFRFIDRLMCLDFSENSYYKKSIYTELDKLSDHELEKTLMEIGINMTDTMEFNFYGAHTIDFSALLTIKKEEPSYTLAFPTFIYELKSGNLKKLNEAMEELPEIFNSYRFIDYLLSTSNDEGIIARLTQQRSKCNLPNWMEEVTSKICSYS